MPRSTYRYPFEFKVFDFASELAQRLRRDLWKCPFVMKLDVEGNVLSLLCGDTNRSEVFPNEAGRINHLAEPHILYAPFYMPEYCYLAWCGVERTTMERIIGAEFNSEDFVSLTQLEVSDQPTLKYEWPVDWAVMF